MKDQLFIPQKLRVGYQERSDTYTGKLAYVIYYDTKNKLRKEDSWKGWIKKDMGDFDNVPTEGFVLNKDVGGTRHSYGWNARMEKVRVFDPRGFEFEISIPNLLYILQECTSTKGKGLEGQFVLSWYGKEGPILLPVGSKEYQNSHTFSAGLTGKVTAKELVPGCAYRTKKQNEVIFLGKFNHAVREQWSSNVGVSNGYVFVDPKVIHVRKKDEYSDNGYTKWLFIKTADLSAKITDTPVDNYAELMDEYAKSGFSASYTDVKRSAFKFEPDEKYVRSAESEAGKAFSEIDKDNYRVVRIKQFAKNSNSGRYGYYGWEVTGYKIVHSPKVITFANGEMSIKETPVPKDDTIYSAQEIADMGLKTLNVSMPGRSKLYEVKV